MTKNRGGRAKGTLNRSKAEPLELSKKLGVNPLEILLLMAGGKWKELGYETEQVEVFTKECSNMQYRIPIETRAKAAADACKYLYAQLRNVEGKIDTVVVKRPLAHLSDEELDSL